MNNQQAVININNILMLILEEEEEEDNMLESLMIKKKRKSTKPMFLVREQEGFYEKLIKGPLMNNEKLFREFFRLNLKQFNFVLSLEKNNISSEPYNRVQQPITPEEKLVLTLR